MFFSNETYSYEIHTGCHTLEKHVEKFGGKSQWTYFKTFCYLKVSFIFNPFITSD